MMKKLSAVIACYRDEPAIPIMYKRLKNVFEKIGVDYEIIFVNDGSPDNTRQVLSELAAQDKKVIGINHSRNFGSQSAFTSGMRIATGDAVVLLDGDLQDPPELIEPFFHKWCQGYDVVYGVRAKRITTKFLQFAYKAFYRLFRSVAYVPVPLDAGDFSLLDRRVVDALNNMPETNRFIRGLRCWVGFKQTGVSYVRQERMSGHSTNTLLRNLGWARKAIVSFSYAPLELIGWLALIIVGFAFITGLAQIAIRLLYPELTPSGLNTVVTLILFMGGVQLLCLYVIASYMEHNYDEIKHRPPYIVESYFNYPKSQDDGETQGKNERS